MKRIAYEWRTIVFYVIIGSFFYESTHISAQENKQVFFFCEHLARNDDVCVVCAYGSKKSDNRDDYENAIHIDKIIAWREKDGRLGSGNGIYSGKAIIQNDKATMLYDKASVQDGKGIVDEHAVFSECIFDGRPFGCDQTEVEQIDFFETEHHTFITILQDKKGKKFVVKQETRDALTWHLGVARDKLGSLVAQSVAIFANRVEIIPSYCRFPGKRAMHFPATLHDFVPGVQVTFLSERCARLQKPIRQLMKSTIPQQRWGLTDAIIGNMSAHEDLCRIVALDTFLANADRNDKNYFYDEASDHFFAIDFESSFQQDLARYACMHIKSLITNKYEFISMRTLRGLSTYQKMLKRLLELHTPESLYEQLERYALEGGIISRALKTDVEKKLERYRLAIKDNYESCKQLVALIDMVFVKYK